MRELPCVCYNYPVTCGPKGHGSSSAVAGATAVVILSCPRPALSPRRATSLRGVMPPYSSRALGSCHVSVLYSHHMNTANGLEDGWKNRYVFSYWFNNLVPEQGTSAHNPAPLPRSRQKVRPLGSISPARPPTPPQLLFASSPGNAESQLRPERFSNDAPFSY